VRTVFVALLFAVLALPGVAGAAAKPGTSAKTKSATTKPAKSAQVLPWVEDEYTRAVADAKARKLPLFVESWAPW
jgi:hypothetical protein